MKKEKEKGKGKDLSMFYLHSGGVSQLSRAVVTIRFQPVGSAPPLRQKIFKVSSANRFQTVVGFLSKKLAGAAAAAGAGGEGKAGAVGNGGGVFCYVNSVFAPGLDEGVGGLWKVGVFTFIYSLGLGRRGYMRGLVELGKFGRDVGRMG